MYGHRTAVGRYVVASSILQRDGLHSFAEVGHKIGIDHVGWKHRAPGGMEECGQIAVNKVLDGTFIGLLSVCRKLGSIGHESVGFAGEGPIKCNVAVIPEPALVELVSFVVECLQGFVPTFLLEATRQGINLLLRDAVELPGRVGVGGVPVLHVVRAVGRTVEHVGASVQSHPPLQAGEGLDGVGVLLVLRHGDDGTG